MITKENISSHELVGLPATIERCSNSYLNNLSGRIILETKNMITIQTNAGGVKQISKSTAKKIRIDLGPDKSCCIAGTSLVGRPEDRLSKLR